MERRHADPGTLDILVQVGLDARQLEFQALDALDTKAGILLAVDSLLIAAATQTANPWMRALVIIAFVTAALPALRAIAVSKYDVIGVAPLTKIYLAATPTEVKEQVLAHLVRDEEQFTTSHKKTANRVRAAFWCTVAAIAILATAAFIPA